MTSESLSPADFIIFSITERLILINNNASLDLVKLVQGKNQSKAWIFCWDPIHNMNVFVRKKWLHGNC